jgi:nucleolar protein 14
MESIRSLLYSLDSSNTGSAARDVDTSIAKLDTQDKADQDYDKVVRELAFEQRAKPKDRTKTDEEIALEQKHLLETAERKRLRRMMGEEDSDSEEETGRRKRRRQVGGDDLEDDFYDEEGGFAGLGIGLTEDAEGYSLKASNTEPLSDEDEDSRSSSRQSDEDEDSDESESQSEGLGSEGEEPEELVSGRTMVRTSSKTTTRTANELPFTFPCPASHEEFLDILDGIEDKDVPTVVQRIRTLHHPSLAEDNKFKLQVILCCILIRTSNPFY